MKKSLLLALILVSSWSISYAHDGDTTCTENCKELAVNTLLGEWAYTNFAYKIVDRVHSCGDFIIADDAFLKFQFDENGTFTKTFGTNSDETFEFGTWDISEDNLYLVLYPNDGSAAQFIKINKLEEEKVELELNIETMGLSDLFCSKINVLNFNKNILPLSNSVIR